VGSQFDLCVPIFKAMNSQIKLRNFRQRRMILWEMTVEQQLTIYRGTTRWLNYYSPSKFGHIFFVHPFKVQNPRAKNSQATTVLVYWLPIPNENEPFLDAGTIFSCSDSFFEVQLCIFFWLILGSLHFQVLLYHKIKRKN